METKEDGGKKITKIIVIGLDGGSFNFIDLLIDKGELPNIKKMISKGVRANLRSTNPPVTCPAWPSFMTGKHPAKHGLFGFVAQDGSIASYEKIKGSALWDILGNHGKKSLVINVPVTYPPYIKNGVMVSSILTPVNADFVYPKELRKEIEDIGYVVGFDEKAVTFLKKRKYYEKFLNMIEKRYELYEYLSKKNNYDMKIVVFSATDVISHKSWDNQNKIHEVYKKVDEKIGKIIEAEPDANFMLISDHGFGDFKKYVRINQFLEKHGLLIRKQGKSQDCSTAVAERRRKNNTLFKVQVFFNNLLLKTGLTREFAYKHFSKGFIRLLAKTIPPSLIKQLVPVSDKEIDKEKSKAFLLNSESQSIVINTEDREERELIKSFLIRELTLLKDPETNSAVFRNILAKEEAFGGSAEFIPELYLDTNDYLVNSGFGESILSEKDYPFGKHHSDGIFIAYGQDIKDNLQLGQVNIIDLAPTILYAFGIRNVEMDGKVLKDIFK